MSIETPKRATETEHDVGSGKRGGPKIHLAINIVHLLATTGAVIETAREIVELLHLL